MSYLFPLWESLKITQLSVQFHILNPLLGLEVLDDDKEDFGGSKSELNINQIQKQVFTRYTMPEE